MNLLIVEDDESTQTMLGMLLELWGFNFDIASNGKEAVELAESNEGKYDICFMDTDMPVMNGFEATKIIRQNVRYFPILSTSGNFTYENRMLEIGADEFIAKPYNLGKLKRKITEWCDIKTFLVRFQKDVIETRKELPVGPQHANELKKLKEKGLVIMMLDGHELYEVIVHENMPYKISHDFNIKKYLMTEFLNRNTDKPTLCNLYRGNKNFVVETFLDEDEYTYKMATEDEEMTKYTKKYFAPDPILLQD
ncbi:MAG: response regulator [Desulfobacterales bacterium]|nr:response regulator [Desulfobacterales bacterium]